MTLRVLVVGGYGNFGGYICRALAGNPAITLIVAGRDAAKARSFATSLAGPNPALPAELDIGAPDLAARLGELAPGLVIHTVGPFQNQDYRVAEASIAVGAHYCDLADARAFVRDIGALDDAAKAAGAAVIAGASSVPCLTAAYLDDALSSGFASIERIDYGITAAQQTNRGLGTASAILSYIGRPFTQLRAGRMARVFGWQGLRSVDFPKLGRRWFGWCDVPDLDLFPTRYAGLREQRFSAGHEITVLHLGTWLLSWAVRLRLLPQLDRWGRALLRGSFLFDPLGSDRSGFYMTMVGTDADARPLRRREWLIAGSGHGPNIPCMPAILLARRIAAGETPAPGARPCLDIITLADYLAALEGLDIETLRE